jgi:hypothetical protein
MEIYILRDGKELGPFDEATTQTMLKRGEVLINDLAWKPGMGEWIPLHSVLYPAPAPAGQRPPPPPKGAVSEPAGERQKAFLSYMGIPFDPEITRDAAALLVNDALENPKDPGRLMKWNEDRLRLHPELFAAEIKAKKENRANFFQQQTETVGKECFTKVTKAHCQVLIGFLDVRYPNWDANEKEATWGYLFPAVAEKFPQLVTKEWKGRLKYADGPRVAPEVARRGTVPVAKPKRSGFAFGAIAKGLVMGLLILVVLYAGYEAHRRGAFDREKLLATWKSFTAPAERSSSTPAPAAQQAVEPAPEPAPASSSAPTPSAPAEPAAPATEQTMQGNPAVAGAPAESAQKPTTDATMPVLDLSTPTPAPTSPPAEATPAPRNSLTLTRATEVTLPFGRIKLPAGTPLKLVAREGAMLRVRYGNDVFTIPATSTDLETPAPAPTSLF